MIILIIDNPRLYMVDVLQNYHIVSSCKQELFKGGWLDGILAGRDGRPKCSPSPSTRHRDNTSFNCGIDRIAALLQECQATV